MSYIEREGVLTTPGGRRIGWAERGASEGRPVAYLHGMPGSRKDIQALFSDEETGHFGPWLWPDAVLGLITGR